MSYIGDGWQRIIRLNKEHREGTTGFISLKVENEDLGLVAQNVWVSPTNAVQVGDAKLFEYVGGNIRYIGKHKVLVSLETYQSITVDGNNSCSAEGSGGLNNEPCLNFSMPSSSAFDGEILLVNQCRFEMVNGDTLDAFVRQVSEVGSVNITVVKGVYHVHVMDVLD